MTDETLPPLPFRYDVVTRRHDSIDEFQDVPVWCADDMRRYARAALAAERKRYGELLYVYHEACVEVTQATHRLAAVKRDAQALALAAVAYDKAIQACANSPDTMSSYCTAEGDDLDALYARFIDAAREALKEPT